MEKIVISLGGSLVIPKIDFLDLQFILRFKKLILKFSRQYKFFIVVGGGKLARFYQKEAKKTMVNQNDLDWLGIFSSRLNTQLVKSLFAQKAFSEILMDPLDKRKINQKVIFAAGWKPGWSTDFVSVSLAQTYKIKEILNLTNVDYIYDQDPKKFKEAKPFKKLNWHQYLKIIGRKWQPGANYPFDPVASLLAKKLKIKLISINGKNLKTVDNYLTGKNFIGTIVEPETMDLKL